MVTGLSAVVRRIEERSSSPSDAADRIAQLFSLATAVASEIDVPTSLREVADAARELLDADGASVVVVAADGLVGDEVLVGRQDDENTTRSAEILAAGQPAGTLRVNGSGRPADGDGEVLEGLAGIAGVLIANARLWEEARLAARWIGASEEVNERLLTGARDEGDFSWLVGLVVDLADAAFVGLVLSDATRFTAQGGSLSYNSTLERDPSFHALASTVSGSLGEHSSGVSATALETVAGSQVGGFGPTMVIPWGTQTEGPDGAFVVARGAGGHEFTAAERQMAERFVRSISIARALATARTDRESIALSTERERIARDLHDHVIQSLFAVGLGLQSALGALTGPAAARISGQIDSIDVIIRQIRATIFELGTETAAPGYSQKQRLNQLVRTTLDGEGMDSSVTFTGPVDTLVDSELGDEVEAVLREALSNVVRHAHASRVDISIAVTSSEVHVVVTDNGRGVGRLSRRSGLDNLLARARARGGDFVIAGKAPSGTTIDWTVPV
jgi:signal transduction histidine kinase